MNQVFHDYFDKFVVVYIDDIVVYSASMEEHLVHLKLVFDRLRKHQLYVKMEKCEFGQAESRRRDQPASQDHGLALAVAGWAMACWGREGQASLRLSARG